MNNNLLKEKTISGFAYKFAERVGAQGINFVISLILARILMPEEYGLIALVTVFITICDVFVTYGFGNSLIVNKDADSIDFSTCFYFGLVLAAVVYTAVFFLAPVLEDFYNYENITIVVRIMALRIPIAAVNSVQHAYVSKHMIFKKFFYATLIGTVISGAVAVIMAYSGFGIWALVEQYLGNVCIDTVCLWIIVEWRPTKQFSVKRLKAIYSYGWKILVVGLIDTTYGQLRSLLIGKKYTSSDLAYYNKGTNFPAFAMTFVEPTVNTVLFPALSNCQDDKTEMKNITQRVIKLSTFITFPVMLGLLTVSKTLVVILLTEKWLPCVIYFQIACIAYMFRPQQFINNCVVRASGDSGLLLKLDILKKSIGIILLLISINIGVKAVAVSLIFVYLISTIINMMPNRNILGYGYAEQFKDIAKQAVNSVIMAVCTNLISFFTHNNWLLLFLQIICGVLIYALLCYITKDDNLIFIWKMIKQYRRKEN